MKRMLSILLVFAMTLPTFSSAQTASSDSNQVKKTPSSAASSESGAGGFDRMLVAPEPGQTPGTGSSGGYGKHAEMPGEAVGGFDPPTPAPGQTQQQQPAPAPKGTGKGKTQQKAPAAPARNVQQKSGLAQIINGVWRVHFSNGAALVMNWRFNPEKRTFFDGQKEGKVQVSGYTIQAKSVNTYTGSPQLITIQFISPNEAVGTIGAEKSPRMQEASAVSVQFRAVKIQ
ncbi:MAG: hypothetical protein AB9866_25595 [Syntrophobacteraceae bacterium]